MAGGQPAPRASVRLRSVGIQDLRQSEIQILEAMTPSLWARKIFADFTCSGPCSATPTRLAGKPGLKYGWHTLTTRSWSIGDRMAVIGHPGGGPKKFSPGEMVACSLRFDAPITGGSSGSPVLNEYGFQIGVLTNESPGEPCDNFGVRVSRIFDLDGPLPERARAALSTVVPAWMTTLAFQNSE